MMVGKSLGQAVRYEELDKLREELEIRNFTLGIAIQKRQNEITALRSRVAYLEDSATTTSKILQSMIDREDALTEAIKLLVSQVERLSNRRGFWL